MHKTKEAGINAKELEKLKGILGNDSLELLTAVKEIVNHSDKPLKSIYYASGSDLANHIAATGATTMIFIDEYDQVSGINDEITQIGGNKKKDAYSGDRVEMDFGWGGKEKGR